MGQSGLAFPFSASVYAAASHCVQCVAGMRTTSAPPERSRGGELAREAAPDRAVAAAVAHATGQGADQIRVRVNRGAGG